MLATATATRYTLTENRHGFLAAWQANPRDLDILSVWADALEEQGDGQADLFREFAALMNRSRHRLRTEVPAVWENAIERLPAEWRSVFAAGCASRCILWMPAEYRAEQLEDCAALIDLLAVKPWSAAAWDRYAAARARSEAARSRSEAARSRSEAARARSEAARSRSAAAWDRYAAAWDRYAAAWNRYAAAWARSEAARSRSEAARSRSAAAWARFAASWVRQDAEVRWQARWLAAVTAVVC